MSSPWQSSRLHPPDNTWCWVSDGLSVWIAKRNITSCGGWTNDDTWEDFGHEVKYWIPIVRPAVPIEEKE